MRHYCVVTTIHKPTKAIEKLHEHFGKCLIVVGDEKTPEDWNYKDVPYILDLPDESKWYEGYAPRNHYARKNLGYLEAIKNKAASIIDTDDDTYPNERWQQKYEYTPANDAVERGWFNVYKMFSDDYIWPRGFSLKSLGKRITAETHTNIRKSSIQQDLVDADPDVDAIWRLVLKKEHYFSIHKSIFLRPGSWCPFNSQATIWFPQAYALMYLPIYATFRMCDIWRSFVAQRCLWEISEGVVFHSPSQYIQERNQHNLLEDFKDEIPGYLHNDEIIETLQSLKLKQGYKHVCENLLTCYQAIVDKNFLPEKEILSVKAWIKDYENAIRTV